jgi:hypothetical protein
MPRTGAQLRLLHGRQFDIAPSEHSTPLTGFFRRTGLFANNTLATRGLMRPNILFIIADDLNSWIGALGRHPDVKTPSIDALALRGALFKHAYCSAPALLQCQPYGYLYRVFTDHYGHLS